MTEIRYPYQLSTKMFLFLAPLAIIGACAMEISHAMMNQLIASGGILDPGKAGLDTYFIHGLSAMSLLVGLLCLWVVWFNHRNPRELVLGGTALSAPAGALRSAIVQLRYQDMLAVQEVIIGGHDLAIRITHERGHLDIRLRVLPDRKAFHQVYECLKQRVKSRASR